MTSRGFGGASGGPSTSGHQSAEWESMAERLRAIRIRQAEVREQATGTSSWWTTISEDPRSRAPDGVVPRAPADNAQVFGALLQGGGLLPVILQSVNLGLFRREFTDTHSMTREGFILASCITSLRTSHRDLRKQQLVAEMLAPYFPIDRIIPESDAREELRKILNNVHELTDQPWFMDTLADLNRTDDPLTTDIRRRWNPTAHQWAGGVSLEHQLELIELISLSLPDRTKARSSYTVLMCILSFALRGEISQSKLTKIMSELSLLMPGIGDQLSRGDIVATWQNFGSMVNDGTVGSVFARWLGFLDTPAIRIRVIIAQAAGSRLTSLDVIARAIHEHPDFPWHLLMRLYPDQWENAVDAIRRVGDNPYYGYRGDLQHVRSSRYKSLSWACGRLLIVGGDKTLSNYRGFVEDKRNKDFIDSIVHGYFRIQDRTELDSDPKPAEYASFGELLTLVKQHPANTGLLMNIQGHVSEARGGNGPSESDAGLLDDSEPIYSFQGLVPPTKPKTS